MCLLEGTVEPAEPGVTTKRLAHAGWVHDVIPVRAVRRSLHIRRAVQVRDPQLLEVRGDGRGGVEIELLAQLHPVGCARIDPHRRRPRSPCFVNISATITLCDYQSINFIRYGIIAAP